MGKVYLDMFKLQSILRDRDVSAIICDEYSLPSISTKNIATDGTKPLYVGWENDKLVFYTDADSIVVDGPSMSSMFMFLKNLTDISGLRKWDTSKVESMSSMFSCCYSLKDLSPLSSWDVSHVKDMKSMFSMCYGVTDIRPLERWNLRKDILTEDAFLRCNIKDNLTLYLIKKFKIYVNEI